MDTESTMKVQITVVLILVPQKHLHSPFQTVHIRQKKRNWPLNWLNCPLKLCMGHSNQKLLIPDCHSNGSASATPLISELHFVPLPLHFIWHYSVSSHILYHGWIIQWQVNSLHSSFTAFITNCRLVISRPHGGDAYIAPSTPPPRRGSKKGYSCRKRHSGSVQNTPSALPKCSSWCLQRFNAPNSEYSWSACRLFSS